MIVREVNKLTELILGKQRKGTAGEFEAIDVMAHSGKVPLSMALIDGAVDSRFENILKVPFPHSRVIWAPDFGNTDFPGLWWTSVVADETEGTLILKQDFRLLARRIACRSFCE
jgi:hypothetical protein